jgi:sugar phosphate isomerase/epimerase
MKIGFRTAGFHERPIHEALDVLADLGYDGVEICLEHKDCRPETLTPSGAADLAAHCRDAGLQVASVSYHADFEEPKLRRANTLRGLDLLPAFGADVFIINGRRLQPDSEAEAHRELAELLDELLPRAEGLGLRVAVEPEPGLSVGGSAEMQALLDLRRSPSLAVNLDVGHAFLTDPDVCASIRTLGSAIAHTHLEGMPAREHKHLLPGEGDLDLVAVCRTLAEIGYQGYYTIDLFNIADDPAGWAASALAGMRAILAETGA